ncbi:DUF2188 domain-containing protein [Synechococcus elongatus]|uniref:DUF2188 domain-containing protein n=1 Tax=Synechococcus elongatus TaxID=32046 RepID=UPI000F7DCA01|nr:DUF2188 domain-containing protein [Synechococcus elongatus]
MSKNQDRIVYKNSDGDWVNKRNSATRASSLHQTQKEAERVAKEMLRKAGGGELTIKRGKDGKIRSKDTIARGNDPNPPRDTEH